jgi:two-component system, OmpR family, sensor histidine kinase KdpD
MDPIDQQRPDPDALLNLLKKEEEKEKKGKLKIFFGMCAGVGKTYDMLKDAQQAKAKRTDVVIGYVETHKRAETEALLAGLPIIPRRQIEYRGTTLEEMDLDAILARKPKLALIDELAHTNAPGSRHTKRYQDVLELLDNGIDVFTTLNVQHLESRADTVAQITGSTIWETVPDSVFESADEIEIIDIAPDELLKRLAEGKVYTPERSKQAIENFFRQGNLTALREMSLRLTAERVDRQLRDYMRRQRISGPWKTGQRILVGISSSPYSVPLIRWARRLSYTMDASWIAVYVETSARLNDKEKEQLSKNIKLAEELGAEIFTTSGEDIAGAIIRIAREQNVSQILVGKPERHLFSRASRHLNDLIERSRDLDIYIVGHEETGIRKKGRRRFFRIQSGLAHYLIASAIVLMVALLCFPLTPYFGYRAISFIILLTVSLLPLRMGPGPVLVAAALGALAWDFFFIPPLFTFSIGHIEDQLMLGMYFTVAIVTGVLSARVRAREKAVRQREEKTSALYALTKDLASTHSQDEVITTAVAHIKKYFNAHVVIYLGEPDGDIHTTPHPASTIQPDAKEFSVAAWVYWNEKKAGKYTETLPFAHVTYYPISGPRYPLGVVGVQPPDDQKFSIDQETLLQNFIAQISSTIERELLNEFTKKSIVIAESERLYQTLFNSISHELRTPIAAIMGASENLLNKYIPKKSTPAFEYTHEIHTAAERLNRLVENLLDMTRLESGRIQPKLDWCDISDLINVTVNGMEQELAHHPITVRIPDTIPLMKGDFGLLEQALTNLIHNATQHTPDGTLISIDAWIENTECIITVADNGPGLPEEDLKKIFEKFYRAHGSRTGGTGLGLTIAKGFIEAHHGTITVKNRHEGGIEFTIRVPVNSSEIPRVEEGS